jgi:hypothetical protein
MKRLFLAIVALAMPFAIFMGICEYRLSTIPSNQIAAKKYLLKKQNRRVKVLVLGSSHSYYGILPAIVSESTFNLAGVSQSLYYDSALLNRCLETLPSLELVILPVSYFSMENQLDDGIESWRSYYYRYEWGIPHRDWHMAWHVRNFSAYFLCLREIGFRDMILGRIKDATTGFDRMGGCTKPPLSPENSKNFTISSYLQESALIALKRHHRSMKMEHIQENERILNDMAHALKRKGIGLAFVTLPVSKYYSEGMESSAYQRMQNILHRICLSNGGRYLNYTFDKRFSDVDFQDADHLSATGALKFSLILKGEIVSRRFASKSPKLSEHKRHD